MNAATGGGVGRQRGRRGAHWTHERRLKEEWYGIVRTHFVGQKPPKALAQADLAFLRVSVASREPDFDNLVASYKDVLDALVHWKVIQDDKPSVIGSPWFGWNHCKHRNEQGIWIHVSECDRTVHEIPY